MTDTTDKVAFAAAELNAASDALASAAAEVDALRAEVARQTGIAVDHCARADAAERMVAELREAIRVDTLRFYGGNEGAARLHLSQPCGSGHCGYCSEAPNPYMAIAAALASTAEVAGRWVSVEEHYSVMESVINIMALVGITEENAPPKEKPSQTVGRAIEAIKAERDAAIAARDEAVAAFERSGAKGLVAMAQRDAAERARDEVGIQYAAAQAEIARMRPVVEAARDTITTPMGEMLPALNAIYRAICALDAVPGDALAPRITAALEASGIDTSNVKGVE